MKGERNLFPSSQLVTEESRRRWKHRAAFILLAVEEGRAKLTEWEETFVQDIEKRMSDGKDLTLSQSSKLNQIFHKIEEAAG